MKAKELRELTLAELATKLNEYYQELFNLRVQLATHQLTNYRRIAQVKRDIARIKTVIREKELRQAG